MIQTSTSYQANIQVIGYAICNLTGLSVWLPREEELILTFIDAATHSDLFG